MKPAFAIIGCGKVGVSLAWHLAALGYRPAGFASRRSASAHVAAEAAGGGRVCRAPWKATHDADLVFITTHDAAIQSVAEELGAKQGVKRGAVVLHCSGVLASTILKALRGIGAHIGSLHPLQSFAGPTFPFNPFQGIVMAGEGDHAALMCSREIADDLGAEFLAIDTENKILYHAAAVVASNYLVTLMSAASRLLEGSGIAPEAALKVLLPLVRGTLKNMEQKGIADALTGPIARGDRETVASHCHKIGQSMPDMLPLYRLLGSHTLPLAKTALDDESIEALKTLLQQP